MKNSSSRLLSDARTRSDRHRAPSPVPAIVGTIMISAARKDDAARLRASVARWLEENRWSQVVSLQVSVGKSKKLELRFVPGEYQSNRERILRFEGIPTEGRIKKELSRWLFEVDR